MSMTLTARYIRRPRRIHVCDWCDRTINGPYIYLYGAPDTTDKPYALRLHVGCCPNNEQDPKIAAALVAAESNQHKLLQCCFRGAYGA